MKKHLLLLGLAGFALSAAAQTVYFEEDFEWLEPWTTALNAGDNVGNDDPGANAPQIVKAAEDGTSALDEALSRGYEFVRYNNAEPTTGECIYTQKNYLKMGKTGFHAGILLPALTDLPDDAANLHLSYVWCPQRQGSGKIDPITLVVVIYNGEEETVLEGGTHEWENGHVLEWIPTDIDLSGVTVNKDSRILIRNNDAQMVASTANRWFIDNIKVYSSAGGGAAIDEVASDAIDFNAPVEYYNMQGMAVHNPGSGLYIARQGNVVKKMILK